MTAPSVEQYELLERIAEATDGGCSLPIRELQTETGEVGELWQDFFVRFASGGEHVFVMEPTGKGRAALAAALVTVDCPTENECGESVETEYGSDPEPCMRCADHTDASRRK